MQNPQNFDRLYGIERGRHFYQFYKGKDDFFQVMIPFFQSGLEKGDACIWLVSDRVGISAACQTAQLLIPNFSQKLSTGQMTVVRAEEWYLTGGSFDESKAIQNAETFFKKAQESGFEHMRGAGDAGCIPREDWPRLNEYERKMNSWIRSRKAIGLCAYPIVECSPSQAKTVLELHDDVLVGHF